MITVKTLHKHYMSLKTQTELKISPLIISLFYWTVFNQHDISRHRQSTVTHHKREAWHKFHECNRLLACVVKQHFVLEQRQQQSLLSQMISHQSNYTYLITRAHSFPRKILPNSAVHLARFCGSPWQNRPNSAAHHSLHLWLKTERAVQKHQLLKAGIVLKADMH